MYLYYDATGVLKEIINDEALRQYDADQNKKIYIYIENPDDIGTIATGITSINYWFGLPDGSRTIVRHAKRTNPQEFITGQIPVSRKRNVEFFQYGKNYQFFAITVPYGELKILQDDTIQEEDSALEFSGTVMASFQMVWSTLEQDMLGQTVFTVEEEVILPTEKVTVSEFNYLLSVLDTGVSPEFNAHIHDYNNPHQVTKTQVGLGNVENKTMDTTPTADSTNYVTSGGVKAYVDTYGGKIDVIKKNGVVQPIVDKTVDLAVPTKTSDLTNDGDGTTGSLFTTNAFTETTYAKKALVFKNVTLTGLEFHENSPYAEYPWKITITGLTGVDNSMQPVVVFGSNQAWSGNYSNICESGTNSVTIYSKVIEIITVDIICYYTNTPVVLEYKYYNGTFPTGLQSITCKRLRPGEPMEIITDNTTILHTDSLLFEGAPTSSAYVVEYSTVPLLVGSVGGDIYGTDYISVFEVGWDAYKLSTFTWTGSQNVGYCDLPNSIETEVDVSDWTTTEQIKVELTFSYNNYTGTQTISFNSLPTSSYALGDDITFNTTLYGNLKVKLFKYVSGSRNIVRLVFNSNDVQVKNYATLSRRVLS